MLRVGVKRVFAWTHSVRAAPVQEIVEGDRLEAYVRAADRKPHEATVAAIEPIVIAATIGQFRNVIPRALKSAADTTPTRTLLIVQPPVSLVLIDAKRPTFMHYQ